MKCNVMKIDICRYLYCLLILRKSLLFTILSNCMETLKKKETQKWTIISRSRFCDFNKEPVADSASLLQVVLA